MTVPGVGGASPGRKLAVAAALVFAVPLAGTVGIAVLAGGGAAAAATAPAVTACGPVAVGSTEPGLGVVTDEQAANAGVAYSVAHEENLPDRAVLDAVTAGLAESALTNLDHGDLDSLGVWQERPSEGWGTPEQIMDVPYAAGQFYAHLTAISGWQTLAPDVAAQDVEASGHPDAYTPFVDLATRWTATMAGTADCNPTDGYTGGALSTADGGLPAGFALPADTPLAAVPAIDFAISQLGKPYLYGGTGPDAWDCSGLVQAAYAAAGIQIPRVTSTQVLVGTPVYDPSQLLPGDLIFIAGDDGTDAVPGHVGMYLGSGLVLHAPYTGQHVRADPVAGWPIVAIRRYAT